MVKAGTRTKSVCAPKPPATSRRRAVKDADKQEKRDALLRVAATLFLKKDFSAISMDDVAEKARVAKGTLYLYFKTKEELALGVLTQDTAEWLTALHEFLARHEHVTAAHYATWFCESLRARPRYMKFIPISALILEKNISKAAARDFKLMVSSHITALSEMGQSRLRLATPHQTSRFFMQCHALVMGLYPCCFPSPVMASVIIEEKLGLFNNDFFETLEDSITALLLGYQRAGTAA